MNDLVAEGKATQIAEKFLPIKVFVLKEEVDVVGVFLTKESALRCAQECELFNFYIEEFTVVN